jgi:hypothetical protein
LVGFLGDGGWALSRRSIDVTEEVAGGRDGVGRRLVRRDFVDENPLVVDARKATTDLAGQLGGPLKLGGKLLADERPIVGAGRCSDDSRKDGASPSPS